MVYPLGGDEFMTSPTLSASQSTTRALVYQTIDDAFRLIGKHGHRAVLRKRDLKDAFRMIPPSPFRLLVIHFRMGWKDIH